MNKKKMKLLSNLNNKMLNKRNKEIYKRIKLLKKLRILKKFLIKFSQIINHNKNKKIKNKLIFNLIKTCRSSKNKFSNKKNILNSLKL